MRSLITGLLLTVALPGSASSVGAAAQTGVREQVPSASPIAYPSARQTEASDIFHGVVVPDPYRWMEDLGSPELKTWIESQNRLSAPRLQDEAGYAAIRENLERLSDVYPKQEPGFERGGRTFFRVYSDNSEQLFVRGPDGAAPRVLLDQAAFGEGNQLIAFEPTRDGRHLAYIVARSGADWGEIRIRDLVADKDLPEVLPNVRFAGPMRWTADETGLLYRRFAPPRDGRLEAPAEDQALYLHRLGRPVQEDTRLYAPPPASTDWSLAFNLPGDRQHLFVYLEQGPWHYSNLGGSRASVVLLELEPGGRPRKGTLPRTLVEADAAYRVLHLEAGRALVFTDKDAPRRRVVSMDLARPESSWQDVLPEGEGVLTDAAWMGGRLVAHMLENVHSKVRVFDAAGRHVHDLALPGTGVVQGIYGDAESTQMSLFYSGLLQAPVVLEHDLGSGETRIGNRSPAAPDMSAFEVRQEWLTSKDGTAVPLFIVARRGLERDGKNPTIIHGYGASSTSELPAFRVDVAAWLQMGGVYAIANVRGGGEFGQAWYEAAIRERKQTSFDDLIAAAEHLVAEGWTRPGKLAISGISNGGLLVTATSLQRPDLFGAVLADVPVTDAMRRHLSGNGLQAAEQWGTPDDAAVFPALRAYSPVHNVAAGTCYPATLITTAHDDQRLPAWHAYKFAAALQSGQGCPAPVLLHVQESGGHGGGELGQWLDGIARRLVFAAAELGLNPEGRD